MRRATALALALLLALGASPAGPRHAMATATASDAVPAPEDAANADAPLSAAGRFIVVTRDGKATDRVTARAGRLGIHADRTFRTAVHGYAASLDPSQLAELRADPDVEAVVPDEVISIAGQVTPTGVRRINGKESRIAGIDGADQRVDADVAIVDTGIGGTTSHAHEDLNIAGGHSCSTSNPNSWGDPNGHGTHVAGIVGALDNGIGVVGAAPGVRLWSVRILDSAGNGLISWYVCGLDWIAAQRDPVDPTRPLFEAVNMSVAKKGTDDHNCGLTSHDLLHQAICRLVASGVTVVAAAGNNGFSAANLKPASYDEVITVSALADTDGKPGGLGGPLCYSWGTYDKDDTFADFSNYGGDVDLIAPGKCIWSTLPGNRYGYMSGTSMAAPLVTGAAALFKASRPLATPAQVKAALRAAGTQDWSTATDPDPVHEPLLDVSHIVALGDWTVDVTPGAVHGALVGTAGRTVQVPVRLYRAEDFPGAVSLTATIGAPLTTTLESGTLTGQDQVATAADVTVPPATASGVYTLTVTASDGTRERTSRFPVTVDSAAPTATPATIGFKGGTTLGSMRALASWNAAADPGGSVRRYEVRWRVDGTLGATTSLAAATRQATKAIALGHTYALRVRARDAAGNWSPWMESSPFAPSLTQDTSPTLGRSAGWKRFHGSTMSGGTSLYSKTHGASITRAFTGRAIALVTTKSPRRGKARIYVDGAYVGTLDTRRSSGLNRVLAYVRSWPTAGPHTLKIVVEATKGRRRVDVDAFVVVR